MNEDADQRLRQWRAQTAVILGSGLNSLVADAATEQIIPYSAFEEIAQPSVPGHAGRFVFGEIGKRRIIFAQGRVHLYEGHSAREVTAIVRVLARVGIKELIVTNAAGTANKDFAPGSWMMIADHINLTGTTPLLGEAKLHRHERLLFASNASAPSNRCEANRHDLARRRLRGLARSAVRNARGSANAPLVRRRRHRDVDRSRSDPGPRVGNGDCRVFLPNELGCGYRERKNSRTLKF